jgi:hypothetical protein
VQIESALKEGDKVVPNLSSQIASGMTVDAHELDVRLGDRHFSDLTASAYVCFAPQPDVHLTSVFNR